MKVEVLKKKKRQMGRWEVRRDRHYSVIAKKNKKKTRVNKLA